MRRILTIFVLLLSLTSYSQEKEIKDGSSLGWSQKFGFDPPSESAFYYEIKGDSLFYRTTPTQNKQGLKITKETKDYVVALTPQENYAFFNLKEVELFVLDFFLNRYMIMSYGSKASSIKQTVQIVGDKLKEGSSQRDVIKYLISQTEGDF
jgi:hypothetical protein